MKLLTLRNIPPGTRRGVTLTEVLMSLMIMSIGVVSVATLFPIAALRSAQATRLTNGAILKYNVEALVRARPELIFDPDGDWINSAPASTPAYWSRLTEHFRANAEKNYVVDPTGYFSAAGKYNSSWGAVTGTSLINAVPAGSRTVDHLSDFLGNTSLTVGSETAATVLPRFDGGLRSSGLSSALALSATSIAEFKAAATAVAGLGDGWDTIVDDIVLSYVWTDGSVSPTNPGTESIVGVQLDSEIDLDGVVSSVQYTSGFSALNDPEFTLITVFSADGDFSQSFPLTTVNTTTHICQWTETGNGDLNGDGLIETRSLPAEFAEQIGRVVIEKRRVQDFSWMLTVRRAADGRAAGVDIVVMFNDGRNLETERVFPANFTANALGVTVNKTSGTDINGDPAEPFLKRGAYVLDVNNARWYRIANYRENPADGTQYLLTLESEAVESSPGGTGLAVFLPGIVDVYPLGSIPLPESMTPLAFN